MNPLRALRDMRTIGRLLTDAEQIARRMGDEQPSAEHLLIAAIRSFRLNRTGSIAATLRPRSSSRPPERLPATPASACRGHTSPWPPPTSSMERSRPSSRTWELCGRRSGRRRVPS